MTVSKPIAAIAITPPLVAFEEDLKSDKSFFIESAKDDCFIALYNLEAPSAILKQID